MKKHLLLLTLLGCLFVFPDTTFAQESPALKKRMKELEGKKENNERKEAAEMEALRKRHVANQTKDVRKRMKRNKRMANRRAAGKPAKRGMGFRNLFKKKGF